MDVISLALRVVLALGVVLALLWFIQRRYARATGMRGKSADTLQVVSRRGVGQKAAVVVVDMDGTRFLLGVTDHTVNVLHSQEAPAPEAAAESSAAAFSETLAAVPGGADVDAAPFRPRRRTQGGGPLAGSVLSPATWKQAGQALGKGLKG